MGWLRKKSGDAYVPEMIGPVEAVVAAVAETPSRFEV